MKRYHKQIAGRATPTMRNQVRPLIQAFAKANGLPFNTVFGAVIQAAEALPGRVTHERVTELVRPEIVHGYEQAQARIRAVRAQQVTGMARRALPEPKRAPGTVRYLVRQVAGFKGSIPELNQRLRELARQVVLAG